MKYEAHDHPDSIVSGWCVARDGRCPRRYFTEHFTEAEARIVEFALNAVADGYRLHYDKEHPAGKNMPGWRAHIMYDGPTL